jgi:hypothetical protein
MGRSKRTMVVRISSMAVRKGPTTAKWRGPSDGEVTDEALGCDWGDAVFCARDKVVKLVHMRNANF